MTRFVPTVFFFFLIAAFQQADAQPSGPEVAPVVAYAAEPFDLADVRLLDGPFKEAMERDAHYLFDLDPDRLLRPYREEAGLPADAPRYGGWESTQLAGHSLGHYLSALALYYAASGDPRARARVDTIVAALAEAQAAGGDGYVGGIPEGRRLWAEIAAGDVRGEAFGLNGVWVPWYNLHKLFAGLLDAYRHAGSDAALGVLTRLADWAVATTAGLDEAQWQEMLKCEHGGMNDVLASLYGITGDARYLDLSRRFHHRAVLGPLAHGEAVLEGKHANTQIPKVIGAMEQYAFVGADSLRAIGAFFWDQVVHDHTYATGGNTEGEHFGPPGRLADRLGPSTMETCNVYNMLKLTRHLFALTAEPRYADFYERALYNHILASQEPRQGMFTYFMSLKPGHFKTYSTPDSSFWCCVGSGMENHVRYGEAIYFHDGDDVLVNLFIPSELTWEEKDLVLRQETRFPEENTTRLVVGLERPAAFDLRLRHPAWADGPPAVRVNGEAVEAGSEDGYVVLRRTWQPGDVVEAAFPMRLQTEPMPDDPHRVAFRYGPIVLAGVLGTEGMPEGGAFADDHRVFFDVPTPPVPTLAAAADDVAAWLRPVDGAPLTFRTAGVGRPADVTLVPFYTVHHQRYTVYWDLVDPDGP